MAKKKRKRRSNPHVLILGNPPQEATLFSRAVELLEYHHVEDPADVVRFHEFGPGVRMYALEDGSILLKSSSKRRPLWAHH